MTSLRLRLLGPPELFRNGQRAVFRTRKALALFAYLTVEKRAHPRERVADLLWPVARADDARTSLRTTIRYLRTALGDAAGSVLISTRDSLGVAPSALLDVDVEALSHARHQVRLSGAGSGLREEVERVISLYRGPFLGDLSVPDAPELDAWLAAQRAQWLGAVSELLDWLSAVQIEADDGSAALPTLERWVFLDPGEEAAWQRLIELHLAQGNRVRARQTWNAYRTALGDLGVEVSPQLQALGSQIAAASQPPLAVGHQTQRVPSVAPEPAAQDEMDLVQRPFVGRGRELMQLRRAFERARAGEPQVVVLEGEAGIGKTRLGEEFLAWAAIQGADVLRARGYSATPDLPFASLVSSLRDRLEQENAPDDLLDDLWLAELAWLFGGLRVRYPDLPPATADPALGHHQLFEAVARLFKAFADRQPPLVIFRDDWHWSDPSGRDLMTYALRRWLQDHGRVLLIVAVSVEQLGTDRALAQWMGSLEREAPSTRLTLERLAAPAIGLWMAALADDEGGSGATDAAAALLGEWLTETAAGNPSRIVAALRSLLEQQVLAFRQTDDSSWVLDLTGVSQLPARVSASVATSAAAEPNRHHDWGDAPDGRLLLGRREELDELERRVVADRCREVAVFGIGGIGKTALTARLARAVAGHFDFVFWRSLRNALPFGEWLTEAIRALSEQQQVTLPDNQEARILLLLELLRTHRCLLILDNLETVLQPGQRELRFLEGYEEYALLLRRLGEVDHQSCLLITSREKPLEITLFEGEQSSVRSLELTGLSARDGPGLLEEASLRGTEEDWAALVERYAGNPLALEIVGGTIGEVFDGDIAAFLTQGEAIYGGIRRLLDAQFERLSDLERRLLYWLGIERESIGFVELIGNLEPPAARGEVLEAIEGLRRRSLLERGRQGATFTLQPVVLEYVTDRLVTVAAMEVGESRFALLRTHALLKAQSKTFIRQSQERSIVAPVLDRLIAAHGSKQRVERHVLALLEELRSQDQRDYAPGNIIKLLQLLRGDLRGLDLSHLFIRQAYLQEVDAQDATLAGSELVECALADAFDCGYSVTFSPDGRKLAAGTSNGEVCVWRLADLTRLVSAQGHRGIVWGIDWAQDGQLLATGGLDGTLKLWEPESGRLLRTLEGHTGSIWRVCFSADGQLLPSASFDRTVRLWEPGSGRLLHTLRGHEAGVLGVAVSTDRRVVASASLDGTVRLWDTASGSLLTTLEGQGGGVYAVALTPDGQLVAGGGQYGTIRVWEVSTRRLMSVLEGHTQQIWRLALSADGRMLVSVSHDGIVRLWNIADGTCLTAFEAHGTAIYDVAINPATRQIATVSRDGTIRLWEVPNGRLVTVLQGYARGAWGLAWDGAGRILANGTQDGTINLWDVTQVPPEGTPGGAGGALRARLRGHTGIVFGLAFSEDGQLLVSGGAENTIRFWRLADGACLRTLQGAHAASVFAVVLRADARLLMSAGQDGQIKLWDVLGGEPLATIHAHTGYVWRLGLSGNGHLLASASQDGTVKLWEIPSGRPLATMRDHDDLFWGLALSRDGSLVASGGQSGRVTLWEAPSGTFLGTLGAHEGAVWGLAFSPDAHLVASAGQDGTVNLWDVATRQLIARCTGHDGPVNYVAISPDGRLVASSSQDGAVMLWDAQSGAHRTTLRRDRRYERMDITGLIGVSDVQKTVLKTLGAVERSP